MDKDFLRPLTGVKNSNNYPHEKESNYYLN